MIRSRLLGTVTLVAVACCLFAGCGSGSDSPTDRAGKALGAQSSEDLSRLQSWFESTREMPHIYSRLVKSMADENVAEARVNVDQLSVAVRHAQDLTLDFDSPKLRRVLSDYTIPLTDVVASADRLIALAEGSSSQVKQSIRRGTTLRSKDFQDAAVKAQATDQDLLNRLSDNLTP